MVDTCPQIRLQYNVTMQPEIKRSSNRTFGITIAIALAVITGFQFYKHQMLTGLIASLSAAATVFLILALVAPRSLELPNRLWALFGGLLHKVTNPIIMGIVFFLAVVPTGLIRKIFIRDPLGLLPDAEVESYWKLRDAGMPTPESMKDQF